MKTMNMMTEMVRTIMMIMMLVDDCMRQGNILMAEMMTRMTIFLKMMTKTMTEMVKSTMVTLRLVLPAFCNTIFSGFRSLWINLNNQRIDVVLINIEFNLIFAKVLRARSREWVKLRAIFKSNLLTK